MFQRFPFLHYWIVAHTCRFSQGFGHQLFGHSHCDGTERMWGRLTLPLQTQEHTHVAPRFAHARASTPNKQYGPGDSDGRDTSKNPSIAWLDTGQTTVRQLANLLQSAGRHPSPKRTKPQACMRERIEHLNQGTTPMSAFILRPMEHLNRLLLGANQTFADAANFAPSLSLSRCSTWPLGSWFLRRKLNWNKSQTNSLLQKWLQETCFFKWYKWQERYAIQLSKREISTILRMWTKFVPYQLSPTVPLFDFNFWTKQL